MLGSLMPVEKAAREAKEAKVEKAVARTVKEVKAEKVKAWATASVGCVDYTWKTKSPIQTGASARDIISSQDGTKRYPPPRPTRH